jgi:hypothetical protein
MDDKEYKQANEIQNAIGDLLEKANIENGLALSILLAMGFGLARDLEMAEADLMHKVINAIKETFTKEVEVDTTQPKQEEGVKTWLN